MRHHKMGQLSRYTDDPGHFYSPGWPAASYEELLYQKTQGANGADFLKILENINVRIYEEGISCWYSALVSLAMAAQLNNSSAR